MVRKRLGICAWQMLPPLARRLLFGSFTMNHRPRMQTMPLYHGHLVRPAAESAVEVEWDETEVSPASQAYERPQRMRGWETDD